MNLRTRFFLWIAGIFFIVMIIVYVFGEYEVVNEMRELRGNIKTEAIKNLVEKKKNYETFFKSRISMNEAYINSTLQSFQPWISFNFLPDRYNLDTASWISISQLLVLAPWLDMLQCTIGDKVTASIRTKTPYINEFLKIKYNDQLTFFLSGNEEQNISIFIGVEYWNIKASLLEGKKLRFVGDIGKPIKHWILYDLQKFINLKPSDFGIDEITSPINPFELVTSPIIDRSHFTMLETTKNNILKVQNSLKQEKDLLNILFSKQRQDWARRELEKHFAYDKKEIKDCYDHICTPKQFLKKDLAKKDYMTQTENQVILSQLIWKYNIMSGHAFMKTYNPLNPKMPNAIVQVPEHKKDSANTLGKGFYNKNVFRNEALPISKRCDVKTSNLSCYKGTNDIVPGQKNTSYYLLGSLIIKPKEANSIETTLSMGMRLEDILESVAIFANAKIFLIEDNNLVAGVYENGALYSKTKLEKVSFDDEDDLSKGLRFTTDQKGNKFLAINLSPFLDKSKAIMIVESHDYKYYELFDKFSEHTQDKLYHVSFRIGFIVLIGFIIGLFILDRVIKRMILPIQSLAKASHMIAKGKLDYLKFMDLKSIHHDEIGKLYEEFILMVEQMKRGRKVESVLNKVVSKEIGDEILKKGKINLKGELKKGTILFADMIKCTELSQEETPANFLSILNQSFGVLSRVIEDHHGVIDKYIGDAIMSLFGIPIEDEHQELHAILASIQMRELLEELNTHRESNQEKKVAFGIGIHTGQVVAGNIGGVNRLNYTVVGYPVNSAARICNYAKGNEILVSDETLKGQGVEELIDYEFHSEITLKGMFKAIKLYKILGRKNKNLHN